jgi:hypothetical protein
MPAHGRKLPSLVEQVESLSVRSPAVAQMNRPWPPNPFPKGIRTGSATEKVLHALKAAHPSCLEHWQLMQITGRSRGAIAWGMRYLQANGLVQAFSSMKNRQYLRYRAVIKDANV